MINVKDFRDCVVAPTLKRLELWSLAAEQLVLATGLHESNLFYLRQMHMGPALSFFQMEPASHDDIHTNYLEYHPELASKVASTTSYWPKGAAQLTTNMAYACAMCRVHYYRSSRPLPPEGDAFRMGEMWKAVYNTKLGAGTVPSFVLTFDEYVKPLYN